MLATAFRPTTLRLAAAAARTHTTTAVAAPRPANSVIPGVVVFGGAVFGVASYIRGQLRRESNDMNRIFAQQNSPEVEANRKRQLMTDHVADPRGSAFNVLGW